MSTQPIPKRRRRTVTDSPLVTRELHAELEPSVVTTELTALPSPQAMTRTQLIAFLSLHADCAPRTLGRAIDEGAEAIRGRVGERIALVAKRHGIACSASVRTIDARRT